MRLTERPEHGAVRPGRFELVANDGWLHLEDDQPAPANAAFTVSLDRWKRDGNTLPQTGCPLGVRLTTSDAWEDIEPVLHLLDLITIDFPAFTDGRGLTIARLLRERAGYEGEIRATGDFLKDQIASLVRCGFDAFEISDDGDPESWLDSAARITHWYQRDVTGTLSIPERRNGTADGTRTVEKTCAASWAY